MTTPDRTRVTVEIYGTSYKLVGSNTDYMKQVANYVDERMHSISQAHSRLDMPRIAVLAAVHMAEEAVQIQEIQSHMNRLPGSGRSFGANWLNSRRLLENSSKKIRICSSLLPN